MKVSIHFHKWHKKNSNRCNSLIITYNNSLSLPLVAWKYKFIFRGGGDELSGPTETVVLLKYDSHKKIVQLLVGFLVFYVYHFHKIHGIKIYKHLTQQIDICHPQMSQV